MGLEDITFEDLFDPADLQRIQDEFSAATGVAALITRPDGTPITRTSNACRLCECVVQRTTTGLSNCHRSNALLGRYHPEGPVIQPCLSCGLWDAGASITVGNRHLANWLVGQVRDETQTEEKIREYARSIGADEAEAIAAFREVPSMSQTRFKQIAQAMFTLANQLSKTAYQNIQQRRLISDLKRTEEALLEAEWKFRALFEKGPIGVAYHEMIYDASGKPFDYRFIDANESYIELTGVDPRGKTVRQAFPGIENDVFDWIGAFGQVARTGKQIRVEQYLQLNGRWYDCVAYQYKPDCFVAAFLDITKRKQAEEELHSMQKLQSVGTLAGGVAHDFNNILMGLFGTISLAKDELPPNHPAYKSLDEAGTSMNRAIRLTRQLLTFAKGGSPIREDVGLGTLVEEVARFDLSGSQVQLVYHSASDLGLADADKGQIQQVISNLTINARQAMPEGGHLFITLENAIVADQIIPGLHPGHYIKITVRDEGTGIDPKNIGRIFDPYFTTKQSGSGLGLATSYSIINKHGGHIGVFSELGRGATFTLYLPASKTPPAAETKSFSLEGGRPVRPARVLVMDDEEPVCRVVSRMLKRGGYSAATAPGGQEAIQMYREALEAGTPFDVVIMDLTIPGGIGGKAAVKNLLEIDPHARVLVSSGYADDPVMANYAAYGFMGVVSKPYTQDHLLDIVAQVLK
jgi:signal transduction histidine kinase/ligand-binding sensor protein/CheY-like chemotaxis protein